MDDDDDYDKFPFLDVFLTEEQSARMLRIEPNRLKQERLARTGPNFVRIGKRLIRYTRKDLLTWINRRKVVLAQTKKEKK